MTSEITAETLRRHRAQGIRKSTALRTLAGECFTDELADLGSKDGCHANPWGVDHRAVGTGQPQQPDVARIKAFMSRTTDRFRPPYGMRLMESPRQCVFAGTVNQSTYLRDETGGRRFWPVAGGRIGIDALARDRDQLWAEAKARFDAGATWWLETNELARMASDQQMDRYEGDPWEEVIAPWLEARSSVSIGEVLEKCLQKAQALWTQTDENRAARCLKALGWERYRERQADDWSGVTRGRSDQLFPVCYRSAPSSFGTRNIGVLPQLAPSRGATRRMARSVRGGRRPPFAVS